MVAFSSLGKQRSAGILLFGILILSVTWAFPVRAQKETDNGPKQQASPEVRDLAKQVADLKVKVMHLQHALSKTSPNVPQDITHNNTRGKSSPMGQGNMQRKGMMGMTSSQHGQSAGDDQSSEMSQMMQMMQMMMQMKMMKMQDGGSGMGMGKMTGGMGMQMMGGHGMGMMGGTHAKGRMQTSSALPGFPGASHVYHVGATGFFLDHPQHITLTKEQQTSLNRIKETSLLQQESWQRKIDEAEKELFVLTGLDQPDASKIEVKVREIEKLKGDKRLVFIRSVGNAAKVLTQEQREVLLGFISPKTDKPSSSSKPEASGKDKSK